MILNQLDEFLSKKKEGKDLIRCLLYFCTVPNKNQQSKIQTFRSKDFVTEIFFDVQLCGIWTRNFYSGFSSKYQLSRRIGMKSVNKNTWVLSNSRHENRRRHYRSCLQKFSRIEEIFVNITAFLPIIESLAKVIWQICGYFILENLHTWSKNP